MESEAREIIARTIGLGPPYWEAADLVIERLMKRGFAIEKSAELTALRARLAAAEVEVNAARCWRDAMMAYDDAEERGLTNKAIRAWNAKEKAMEQYDAVRTAARGVLGGGDG